MNASSLSPESLLVHQIAPFLPCQITFSLQPQSTECNATTCDQVMRVLQEALERFRIREQSTNDLTQSNFEIRVMQKRNMVWLASCKPYEFPNMKIRDSKNGVLKKERDSSTTQSSSKDKALSTKSVSPTPQVVVVPYNRNWADLYQLEALSIQFHLGKNCTAMRHVGSTSVPDLAAKPIIDILAVISDISAVHSLSALGYKSLGEMGIPFMRRFEKSCDGVDYKVMVFEEGSPEIARLTQFRDRLARDPTLLKKYERLKYSLAETFPNDIGGYTQGKSQFIQQVDAEEGTDVPRIIRDLAPPFTEECNKRLGLPPPATCIFNFLLIQAMKPLAVARIVESPTETTIAVSGEQEDQKQHLLQLVQRWQTLPRPNVNGA